MALLRKSTNEIETIYTKTSILNRKYSYIAKEQTLKENIIPADPNTISIQSNNMAKNKNIQDFSAANNSEHVNNHYVRKSKSRRKRRKGGILRIPKHQNCFRSQKYNNKDDLNIGCNELRHNAVTSKIRPSPIPEHENWLLYQNNNTKDDLYIRRNELRRYAVRNKISSFPIPEQQNHLPEQKGIQGDLQLNHNKNDWDCNINKDVAFNQAELPINCEIYQLPTQPLMYQDVHEDCVSSYKTEDIQYTGPVPFKECDTPMPEGSNPIPINVGCTNEYKYHNFTDKLAHYFIGNAIDYSKLENFLWALTRMTDISIIYSNDIPYYNIRDISHFDTYFIADDVNNIGFLFFVKNKFTHNSKLIDRIFSLYNFVKRGYLNSNLDPLATTFYPCLQS